MQVGPCGPFVEFQCVGVHAVDFGTRIMHCISLQIGRVRFVEFNECSYFYAYRGGIAFKTVCAGRQLFAAG